jgi:hypothetical protein
VWILDTGELKLTYDSEREGVVLNGHRSRMIKDVSRLWQYRNGGEPQD